MTVDCAPLRWGRPRWTCLYVTALAFSSTQLRNTTITPPCLHDCSRHAAVATHSSTPASPLRWALIQHFFSRAPTLSRQQAVGVPGISSSPCCRIMQPSSGRAARRAAAVFTPSPGPSSHHSLPTPSRHLCGTSSSSPRHPASSDFSARPHTWSSPKDCCWRVG